MDTFTKYSILPSVLRKHTLSFARLNSLRQYSQCSKLCNEEFGEQYIAKPASIELNDCGNYIKVELKCKDTQAVYFKLSFVEPYSKQDYYLTLNDSYDRRFFHKGNYKQAAVDYIQKRLKYNWNGEVDFDMKFWPFDANDMTRFTKNCIWTIHLNKQMLKQFYNSIKDEELKNVRLHVMKGNQREFNIPAKFFKSPFFQNLTSFSCYQALPTFEEQDFLTMEASHIYLNCSLFSDRVINQKLCQYFNNPLADKHSSYTFFRSNELKFDRETVLRNLNIVRSRVDWRTEFIVVKCASGVEKELKYEKDQIDFNKQ